MRRASKTRRPAADLARLSAEELFREGWRLLDDGDTRSGSRVLLAAAQMGHLEAQQGVGYLHDVGKGLTRSVEKALYWYRKAARRGDAAAATNIGLLYRERHANAVAMRWFRKALALGNSDALIEIAKLQATSPRGHRRAIAGLRHLVARKDITESTREEAEILLRELNRLAIAR